ncbi:TDT family transporter [Cellulomonas composti]|uniref:C4-dicarboxylate ABC transporter n=1 Tax=Cellulomonas composti TaxID=266130 RepID=A0A511JBZ1_9CELL|nr:TDT family transporter [Cellulomonas composti]GEL95496.1 C4-dicarboxylate ABC transporter [Cellulomonas composti]
MLHPAPLRTRPSAAGLTPNWFAAVMGTGIVATAGAGLPVHVPGLHTAASVVWLVAATLLVVLVGATVRHWTHHRERARLHHLDPVMAHFYGAPPMALMTVGAGSLVFGPALLGAEASLAIGWMLWTVGTVLGLASTVVVPVLRLTRHDRAAPFAGWLMPVVPPVVSAATGALLLPHVPVHRMAAFAALLVALLAVGVVATALVLPAVCTSVVRDGVGPAALVPTLWIVLGPLGQSTTAANVLAGEAGLVVAAPRALELERAAVVYGLVATALALVWAAWALLVTLRTARSGLPFGLPWWSFTFPVGTCVTGLSALAVRTGSPPLTAAAALGFVVLVGAWGVVAARTLHGVLVARTLLVPPPVQVRAKRRTNADRIRLGAHTSLAAMRARTSSSSPGS